MIYQYIKELIENNNRIIIPDFGAFMIQSSPDGKQISFNDFLKFNDGLLVNQIIKSEKVSKAQATDSIKAFVGEIEKAFEQNKAFELQGVGYLIKDDHGNIKFLKQLDEATKEVATPVDKEVKKAPEVLATDSTPTIELVEDKEQNTVVKEAQKQVDAKVKEEEKPATPIVEKQEPKTEVKEEEKAEEKIAQEIEKPKAAIPPRQATKPIPKKPIPSKPKTTTTMAEKPKVGTTKQSAQKQSTNSGSKSTLMIIIAAIVVIGGLGGAYFMGWIGNSSQPEPIVEQAPIIPVDTVAIDTTPIMEEPKVIEEPDHDPNAKKYYIVAGSFKVSSNADGYQQRLLDEGYDSEIVVRNNGFHTVSYKTLYNWQEALSEWRNMRATNTETWILVR